MPNWSGGILTTRGKNLQAKVDAGQTTLTFTKMKIGSGILPNGQSLESLTELITPKQNIPISGIAVNGNITTLTAVITNAGVTAGYQVRELGVYATDPTLGEILYSITVDSAPDYLPPEGGAVAVSQEFNYNIAVSNAENVSAILSTSGLVTVGMLQQHNHDGTGSNGPKLGSNAFLDGAVTDLAIGNRTIVDTTVAAAGAGTITNLFSKIGYMLKSFSGKANWYTLPSINLEAVFNLFNASTGHKHTGGAGDAPKIAATGLADGAATDTIIGSRTVIDTTAPTSLTGGLTTLLSGVFYMVKAITGKANGYTAPAITLEATKTHVDATSAHGATSANTASSIVQRDASGNFIANTITAALNGLAATATKLATARTINNVAFDGTADITIADSTKAPITHSSAAATYGVSTASTYGHAMASSATPLADGTAIAGTDNGKYAREGHVHPIDSTRAPLASPALTGVPTAPTASAGTNTTQLATTAFVQTAVSAVGTMQEFTTETISSSGQQIITYSHGLGATPKIIHAYLECKTAEFGYMVGDRVSVFCSTGNQDVYGIKVVANATTVRLVWYAMHGVFVLPAIATTTPITAANWRFKTYVGL